MIISRTLNIEGGDYVVALGTFDGVHIGHKGVIAAAKKSGLPVCVVTSDINPRVAFGAKPCRILSEDLCNEEFERLGVAAVIRLSFESIRELSPIEYLDMLYNSLKAKGFACGFNFRFGKGAVGSSETLKSYTRERGIFCSVCDSVNAGGESISSSRIRNALQAGDIKGVNGLLGKNYAIDFPVIHGDARGRSLGFPTANQSYPADFVIPRYGVYASIVTVDSARFRAITNIGTRPTFCDGAAVAETHIIGESLDLYGKKIKVELVEFLRDEIKFSSANELIAQIEIDKINSLNIID